MKWTIFSVVASLLLALSPSLKAWSQPGHMMIAAMAYDQLSDDEKEKFNFILQSHPKYEEWLNAYPAAGIPDLAKEKYVAMLASLYPDEIRNYDNPETFGYWHFVGYALYPPDFAMKPRPQPGNDVISGIADSETAVAKLDKPKDAATRAKMLSFVLHLIGDIHQPLHCGTMFDERFPAPEGDRGGNKAFVKPAVGEKPIKLHAYWDQLFGPGTSYNHAVPMTMVIAAAHQAKDLASRFKREDLSELAAHHTAEEWSVESRDLVIKEVWLDYQLQASANENDAPELPAGYHERAKAVAERRASLAGYRLADELHTVLK